MPLLFLIGLVAAGFLAWSLVSTPPQRILFAKVSDADKAAITSALQGASIRSNIDGSGSITVAEDDFHKARMLLASQNLPKAAPGGYQILDQLPMGGSRAVEGERLRQASHAGSGSMAFGVAVLEQPRDLARTLEERTRALRLDEVAGAELVSGGRRLTADAHLADSFGRAQGARRDLDTCRRYALEERARRILLHDESDRRGRGEHRSADAQQARARRGRSYVHGTIKILFTPDEEIGRGVDRVDLKKLGADFGYTMDGETAGNIEDETFSADGATVIINGVSAHPGFAKGKIEHAIKIASAIVERSYFFFFFFFFSSFPLPSLSLPPSFPFSFFLLPPSSPPLFLLSSFLPPFLSSFLPSPSLSSSPSLSLLPLSSPPLLFLLSSSFFFFPPPPPPRSRQHRQPRQRRRLPADGVQHPERRRSDRRRQRLRRSAGHQRQPDGAAGGAVDQGDGRGQSRSERGCHRRTARSRCLYVEDVGRHL
ncbi:hypothetical protein [Escherichia coli]|uniref:hypothetical protein n=1 Tax=Escherichia coli TaxID=562 RepID=UPI001A991B87|nr:hypothetical protein [Escherichia coli]